MDKTTKRSNPGIRGYAKGRSIEEVDKIINPKSNPKITKPATKGSSTHKLMDEIRRNAMKKGK